MILPDSAIWIDHIRRPNPRLNAFLATDQILGHPFVTGEVALGSLASRGRVLTNLNRLPQLRVASASATALLIESVPLGSRGIGYVDANLLASVALATNTRLWTRDKRLHAQAEQLGVAFAM